MGYLIAILALILAPFVYNYFLLSPSIPGPFLARFTDLWRLLVIRRGAAQDEHLDLHKKYGDIVRIGPKCVILSGFDSIQSVYGISQKFEKSDFYLAVQGILNGKPYVNLFTTTSNDFHTKIKRPVARAYAMTTLLEYEPFVDTTTILFLQRLDELFALPGKRPRPICDFGKWLQYYAFDVIGEMTFSKRFGFLEHDEDIGGILQSLANTRWFFQVSQMPWVDKYIRKNKFALRATKFTSPVVKFTTDQLKARLGAPLDEAEVEKPLMDENRKDFLSRFLDAKTTHPDLVDNTRVVSYAQANITAGSDTTAITLRGIFYHLLKNPETMQRLQEEIDTATSEGRASTPCVTWSESQKLPYLNAVVKEGLRIHPAVSLPLERIVPQQGLELYGTRLPPGTVVGVNPWVVQRDQRIYGHDAESWRPERWLDLPPELQKRMDSALLAFGAGARTCIGQNISLLEIYKLVPTLVRKYEFQFSTPSLEWKTENAFFLHQSGFDLRIWRRDDVAGNEKLL